MATASCFSDQLTRFRLISPRGYGHPHDRETYPTGYLAGAPPAGDRGLATPVPGRDSDRPGRGRLLGVLPDPGPATRQIDQIVLLLGAADVAASKRFYVDRGLAVAKSFGRKYVEFTTPSSPVKLALYGHRALAKDAGVPPGGTGSHRLAIGSDAGPFTDPDGFAWEAASL